MFSISLNVLETISTCIHMSIEGAKLEYKLYSTLMLVFKFNYVYCIRKLYKMLIWITYKYMICINYKVSLVYKFPFFWILIISPLPRPRYMIRTQLFWFLPSISGIYFEVRLIYIIKSMPYIRTKILIFDTFKWPPTKTNVLTTNTYPIYSLGLMMIYVPILTIK